MSNIKRIGGREWMDLIFASYGLDSSSRVLFFRSALCAIRTSIWLEFRRSQACLVWGRHCGRWRGWVGLLTRQIAWKGHDEMGWLYLYFC